MNTRFIDWLIIPRGLIQPRGLLLRAGLFVAFFLVCHLAGWREYTMILSGTTPAGGDIATLQGILYILAHLGLTVVAPVFVLGAAILAWLNRCLGDDPIDLIDRIDNAV